LDLAYVENFMEDADSNLVHFGYHGDNVNPRPGNGIFSWLYRTDQHGCIFEDCQLSQEELKALPRLGLYPNPAPGGRFFVEQPLQGRPAILEIYNASGALLESHNLASSQSRYRIHSALSPGSYLCLLRSNTGKELGLARVMMEE
ncbi:MAG: T9SS type A sorting domain-containing protein, partial [Schleiferiaceae bacterium]|nr:T9SS type A sorting domain-containing protein [Schleiferiaceae bacterium]